MKRIITYVFVALLLISSALAGDTDETTTFTLTGTQSTANHYGFVADSNLNMVNLTFGKKSTSTSSGMQIWSNKTGSCVEIASASYSGDTATMAGSVLLEAGQTYWVMSGTSYTTRTLARQLSGAGYPISNTGLNITDWAVENGGGLCGNGGGLAYAYEFLNYTYDVANYYEETLNTGSGQTPNLNGYVRAQSFQPKYETLNYIKGITLYLNAKSGTPTSEVEIRIVNLSGGKPDWDAYWTTKNFTAAELNVGEISLEFDAPYPELTPDTEYAIVAYDSSPASDYYQLRASAGDPYNYGHMFYATNANLQTPANYVAETSNDAYAKILWADNNGTGTPSGATDYFVITVEDAYTGADINNVTATVNGTYYTNTTGNIIYTTINTTAFNGTMNLTVNNSDYFNRNYTDYNVSNDLTTELHAAEVTFYAYDRVTNNSITSLTATTTNNTATDTNPTLNLSTGTYTATISKTGYYSNTASFTTSSLEQSSQNVSLYDAALNVTINVLGGSTTDQNFTIDLYSNDQSYHEQLSTTNGEVRFNITSGNYTLYVNDSLHTFTQYNVTINSTAYASLTNTTIDVYGTNSINFTFKDEITNSVIDYETITAEFISTNDAFTNTTTDGYLYVELLDPVTYTIRYSAAGYAQRLHYITVTNRTTDTQTLFLVPANATSLENVSITVIDSTGAAIEGYTVITKKYFLSSNSYDTVEEAITDSEGEVINQLQLFEEFYTFTITNTAGQTVLSSVPQTIKTTSLTLQVVEVTSVGTLWKNFDDIQYTLLFNNATNNFVATYTDSASIASNTYLRAYKVTAAGYSLQNSSSSSSSSSTLLAGITPENGTTYEGRLIALIDGVEYIVDSVYYEVSDDFSTGVTGLFWQFLLTLSLTGLVFAVEKSFSPIAVGLTLVAGKLFALNAFGWFTIIGVCIVGIIIAVGVKE